jgi:type I restriction enzyme S subunit
MCKLIAIEIGNLGTTITGKTPSSNNPEDFGSEYMFITPSDSFDDKMIFKTNRYLSEVGINKLKNKVLPPKSVLVSCIGSAMGKIIMNHSSAISNQQINSIIVNRSFDSDYIYYNLKNNYKLLRNAAAGSTALPMLNKTDFDKLVINIHKELNTQQKIASVLSALDSKIELNNRINAELEAMAKMLYDYWFVQFDFPDKNGKPYKTSGGKMVWNEELKREIPEGWEVKPLSEITAVSNESVNPMDFPDKEFKYYSIPGFDEMGTFKIEKGFEIKSNKYSIKSTDILVSKLNPWFSRVIYSTNDSDLISSTEFVVWRTDNLVIKNYMYMIARDASFVTFCTKSASGTSNSHKRVNPTVMMKYKIVFDDTVATLFGNTLGSSIKMLAKNSIENQKLTELRDWLLPMLMNGQVKVMDKMENELSMAAEPKIEYGK